MADMELNPAERARVQNALDEVNRVLGSRPNNTELQEAGDFLQSALSWAHADNADTEPPEPETEPGAIKDVFSALKEALTEKAPEEDAEGQPAFSIKKQNLVDQG